MMLGPSPSPSPNPSPNTSLSSSLYPQSPAKSISQSVSQSDMRRELLNDDFGSVDRRPATATATAAHEKGQLKGPMGRPKDQWQVCAVIGHCRCVMHANFICPTKLWLLLVSRSKRFRRIFSASSY